MPTLSDRFRRLTAPETGRPAIQLTQGPGTCYPLYFFIPSITADQRYVIYHQAEAGVVQLYRLDLTTAESVPLTHATAAHTQWYPWCIDSGRGVLDHRSVLNTIRNELIYFDDNTVRVVNVATLADRVLFELPADRAPIGQNCVTGDGQWFVYIHHDRASYAEMCQGGDYGSYYVNRRLSQATALDALNLDTGVVRPLVRINSPIHHVEPLGDRHLVFCHPCTENGMLLTDIQGGYYTHLRTQDTGGGTVCHYCATERGIMYEVSRNPAGVFGGMYDPWTHARFELLLLPEFGYVHTGYDPQGRLWFYENQHFATDIHDLHFLVERRENGPDQWLKLAGNWPTYNGGQKSQFHPRVVLDRQYILFTGGDPATQSNHLFLLDIADLSDTRGIPALSR